MDTLDAACCAMRGGRADIEHGSRHPTSEPVARTALREASHERHECHERDERRQPHTSRSGGERRAADLESSVQGRTTLGRVESFPVMT